jgi:hypothetical protein
MLNMLGTPYACLSCGLSCIVPYFLKSSVADLRCLSRIPDPDFYPYRIPDPKTATKERGEKKLVVIPFFVAINFTTF